MSTKEKVIFWSAVSGLSAILIGSCYFLYKNLFDTDDSEETENLFGDDPEFKSKIKYFLSGKLTIEESVKLIVDIDTESKKKFKEEYPEHDDKRRSAIDNDEEYKKLCSECLAFKQSFTEEKIKEALDGRFSHEQFEQFLSAQPQNQIEELSIKYYQMNDTINNYDINTAKQAFVFYVDTFISKMEEFHNKIGGSQLEENPELMQQTLLEITYIKAKCEDLLFIKYGIEESDLRAFLNIKNLMEDPVVKKANEKLIKFSEKM